MKQKAGLYFGSFNPVHSGHISIATYILEADICDNLWFVISPQNPLKSSNDLLADEVHRMNMLNIAMYNNPRMKVCNIEFLLSKPSYTINTLNTLKNMHPDIDFSLIMGMDNLQIFKQWKSWEEILQNHSILVYPRNKANVKPDIQHPHIIVMHEAPLLDISSTNIRKLICKGEQYEPYLPPGVATYIQENNLYKKTL